MPDGVSCLASSAIDWLVDRVWRLVPAATRSWPGSPRHDPGGADGGDPTLSAGVHLILLPSGRIGAGWNVGLTRWDSNSGQLQLFDQGGTVRLGFDLQPAQRTLYGTNLADGGICRLEYQRDLPGTVTLPAPCTPGARRNLVVLRAGPDSLHGAWLRNCPEHARNWDLCLCTYADGVPQTQSDTAFIFPARNSRACRRCWRPAISGSPTIMSGSPTTIC